jgi:hypothetical protein
MTAFGPPAVTRSASVSAFVPAGSPSLSFTHALLGTLSARLIRGVRGADDRFATPPLHARGGASTARPDVRIVS